MHQSSFAMAILASLCMLIFPEAISQNSSISLDKRSRVLQENGEFELINTREDWNSQETAIIVCDMWDKHWCKGASKRVAEIAPYMNEVIKEARDKGIFIIHAPSSVTDFYEGHPARLRAQNAPLADNHPAEIKSWCTWLGEEEAEVYPIDQSDGGCACGDCNSYNAWSRQIASIEIQEDRDAISDSGEEIWNLMEAKGIKNVMLLGVHTNMCVLGRPFGLRNMARYGKNVVLIRDLTDTMYNPDSWPFVDHFTGTDLIVAHIEKYVCPTISSYALTGKKAFRFKDDKRDKVVFIHADREYFSSSSLPAFAHELQLNYNLSVDFAIGSTAWKGPERNYIAGMESLTDADLAVLYVRRRGLPHTQMQFFKDYLAKGNPLLGLRTTNHAFDLKKEETEELVQWQDFDQAVLGGNYHGHHGKDLGSFQVSIPDHAKNHPILKGFPKNGFSCPASLYEVSPLSPQTTVLLTGELAGLPVEPVMWTNQYLNSRVIYTSLGHREDFKQEAFRQLLKQSIFWAMEKPLPEANIKGLGQFTGAKK